MDESQIFIADFTPSKFRIAELHCLHTCLAMDHVVFHYASIGFNSFGYFYCRTF